jgi:hypothetical protein
MEVDFAERLPPVPATEQTEMNLEPTHCLASEAQTFDFEL